jgi:hypothetical protein
VAMSDHVPRGPLGDARPEHADGAPTPGGRPQEKVEDRDNVSTVTPEDYPLEARASADNAGLRRDEGTAGSRTTSGKGRRHRRQP